MGNKLCNETNIDNQRLAASKDALRPEKKNAQDACDTDKS